MARPFKHKRPKKPEYDAKIFRLLRLMRGHSTASLSKQSGVASSTISKWRTRRTRYPQNLTMDLVKKACGVHKEVWLDKDGNELE